MEWMLMPFRRYAEFSGRSRRKEYWLFTLFLSLVYLAFMVLMIGMGAGAFMGMASGSGGATAALGGGVLVIAGLLSIFGLAVLIPSVAVAIRRLHDTGRPGWWLLAPLAGYAVTLIGAVAGSQILTGIGSLLTLGLGLMLLVFYCLDGTAGPNRYGPDPKLRDEGVGSPVTY